MFIYGAVKPKQQKLSQPIKPPTEQVQGTPPPEPALPSLSTPVKEEEKNVKKEEEKKQVVVEEEKPKPKPKKKKLKKKKQQEEIKQKQVCHDRVEGIICIDGKDCIATGTFCGKVVEVTSSHVYLSDK